MKLRDFKFSELPRNCGLCIRVGNEKITYKTETGFVGEVLAALPLEYADWEIESTRWFFDIFVIQLKRPNEPQEEPLGKDIR